MCSVCMSIPCHHRCPNAREHKPVHKCCQCGEGIFEGDKYYENFKGYICMACIEDMSVSEIFSMLGESLITA